MKELKFNMDIEVLKHQIQEGEINTLLFLGQLKRIELEFKSLKELALPLALDEFELQSEKTYLLGDYEFSKTAGGRYSYKHSEEWIKISESKKELEKKMQEAWRIGKGSDIIDGETGEIILSAEYLSNKESISVKIK